MDPLRIVFMGTPDFAVPALEALARGPHRVVAVVTQPDRPAGRGRRLRPPPVKRAAERLGIGEVWQPERIRGAKGAAFRAWLKALAPDLAVVAAYGQILPKEVLETPRRGCINVHASLLPRWRGASPIQWALLAGDRETGVCIIQMDEGLDTGPVFYCRRVSIAPDETAGTLHDKLAALGAELLPEVVDAIARGEARARPQPEEGATYAPRLTKEDGRLDFTRPAAELERRVRAMQPWPGAYTTVGDRRLKVLAAEVVPESGVPGEVLEAAGDRLVVAAGEGALRLMRVQPAGGRPMDARAFLAGRPLRAGTRLGEAGGAEAAAGPRPDEEEGAR